jgi:hypothetical protein
MIFLREGRDDARHRRALILNTYSPFRPARMYTCVVLFLEIRRRAGSRVSPRNTLFGGSYDVGPTSLATPAAVQPLVQLGDQILELGGVGVGDGDGVGVGIITAISAFGSVNRRAPLTPYAEAIAHKDAGTGMGCRSPAPLRGNQLSVLGRQRALQPADIVDGEGQVIGPVLTLSLPAGTGQWGVLGAEFCQDDAGSVTQRIEQLDEAIELNGGKVTAILEVILVIEAPKGELEPIAKLGHDRRRKWGRTTFSSAAAGSGVTSFRKRSAQSS